MLDRPEQAACLVEVHIVRPAVKWSEALSAVPTTSPTVGGAVGAGAVPGHADEQWAVVTEIGRPPLLRIRHERVEILLEGL